MYKSIIILVITLLSISVKAQKLNDTILMIDNKAISYAEFERIYNKNKVNSDNDTMSLSEYMKLFVDFKLKVIEAEDLGLDTTESFIKEINGYKVQLEKPYFTDKKTDSALIVEAYEHLKWILKGSHILILCEKDALPKDTLKAYNKILEIRKKVLNGEDFSILAKKYSEDPSAKSNGGYLGYFTAFDMVYPFEEAAYKTEIGGISKITRTRFGYHIIKIDDKIKNRGQIKVAHIMLTVPKGSSVEKENEAFKKINNIYDSIQNGVDFADMVKKYSDDGNTRNSGGELSYFGFTTRNIIRDFVDAAFKLQNVGDVSKPVKTSYGYHIIKLLKVKPIGTFEEEKAIIKNKISKDERARRATEIVLNRLKKEYKLKIYKNALNQFYTDVDTSLYIGKWSSDRLLKSNTRLFTFADSMIYTQKDFAKVISNDKKRRQEKPLQVLIDYEFNRYVNRKITDFEKSRLKIKYPEYKYLLQEYHDGILLFTLMDDKVWSKAIKDSVGLEKFYNEHKNKYMWGERVEATTYIYNNKDYEPKIKKLAIKTAKKGLDLNDVKEDFINKTITKDSLFTLEIIKQKYSKGDNNIIDALEWKQGVIYSNDKDNDCKLIYINGVVAPEPKLLEEAKGLITADYQNYLEKQWMQELHSKHKIIINDKLLNTIEK